MEPPTPRAIATLIGDCIRNGCAAAVVGVMYLPFAAFAIHLYSRHSGIPAPWVLSGGDMAALATFAGLPLALLLSLKNNPGT